MSPPALARTYTFRVNNRSLFVSTNTVMGDYLFGIKDFLVTRMGYTLKYSCDGTTGPSSAGDHTDRWTDATKARTRGANTAAAASWIVLTDGDGVDFMLAYTSGADDIARYSISQTGVYTPAGTATFPATATDESLVSTGISWIENTASADRTFHLMATSDKKNWRAFICRAAKVTGVLLSLETYTSALITPASQSINKLALHISATSLAATNLFAPSTIGVVRVTGSALVTASLNPSVETSGSGFTSLNGINSLLQGSRGPVVRPIGVWSTTTNARGKLGNLIDMWHDAGQFSDGNTTPDKHLIHLSNSTSGQDGLLWPWDGSTTPQFT